MMDWPSSLRPNPWWETIVFALLVWLIWSAPALADKRVALVLGVSKYQNVPQLRNPDKDAASIADLLKKTGFDSVDLRNDLGVAELRRTVREFAGIAADADVALVYYAGHGIEVDGNNYLIPADARLVSDFDVEDETVSLDRILQALNPAKRLRLVILDACRDNPFAKTMKRSIGTRSVGRGLAKIEPTTTDTLVAFAAKAGAVASDGDGDHSPFAAALMKYIASPGLDLRLAFGKVRDEVLRSTGKQQEPFVYGSLGGDTIALVPQAAQPPAAVDPNAEARRDYEFAAQIGTKEAWASFLDAHPDGLYAGLARAAMGKLEVAEKASAEAADSQRKADQLARQKQEEFLAAQARRQADEAKKQISEQSRRELEQARQQTADETKRDRDVALQKAADAEQQVQETRKQLDRVKAQAAIDAQKQVEAAKQEAAAQAAEAGKAQIAALNPQDKPVSTATPPAMNATELARLLQAHLKRVGCDPGSADGNWTENSQKALRLFNQNAGTTFDVKLASLDALDAIRGKADRVCPLVCGKGQKADGDHCVAIEMPKPPAQKSAVTAARATRLPTAPSAGRCFSSNGKRYCE